VSLEIAISALDSRALAPADGFSTIHLEGARVGEARALYDAIGMRTSGRIVRSESRWTKIFADEELHFMGIVSRAGTLEGYVSFSYEGGPFGPEQKLVVEELTSAEDAATSALFAALSAQRHQVASVELSVPYGDSLAFAFEDAAGPRRAPDGMAHRLGVLCTGPMVRMIDARRALSLRGYAADGDLTFACTDRRETLRLSVEGKEGHAEDVAARADIELTSGTLASIAASGLRPVQAAELGLLRGVPRALDLAEQMFSGPRFQCLDPF
jgi:predicted acetyltransferase